MERIQQRRIVAKLIRRDFDLLCLNDAVCAEETVLMYLVFLLFFKTSPSGYSPAHPEEGDLVRLFPLTPAGSTNHYHHQHHR